MEEPDEAEEVGELLAMLASEPHSPSKRPIPKQRAATEEKRRASAGKTWSPPAWDSTPHRNRPRLLRGLRPTNDEPWMRCETLNMNPAAEWMASHSNLIRSGSVPHKLVADLHAEANLKAEHMGNRLMQQQKRKAAAERKAAREAQRAAQRAEEEAIAAALEEMRRELEAEMLREAQAAEERIRLELERLRLEAEAAAKAAAEEAARLEEEERLRQEMEAAKKEKAKQEAAERKAKAAALIAAPKKPTTGGGFGSKLPPAKAAPAAKPAAETPAAAKAKAKVGAAAAPKAETPASAPKAPPKKAKKASDGPSGKGASASKGRAK